MRRLLSLLAAVCLLAGCSTLTTHIEPTTNLSQLKHVFVQQNLNDNHGLDLMIVREFQARGLTAESGPLTLMPQNAVAYVTYQDQWDWDFKDYLISLGLTVRNARTDQIMASVSYFRPTAFLRKASVMVHLTVDSLFNAKPGSNQKSADGGMDRR